MKRILLFALPLAVLAASCSGDGSPPKGAIDPGTPPNPDTEPVHACEAESSPLPDDTGSGYRFEYCLHRKGNVSVVVFDAEGHVVRELLHGAPRAFGWHSEVWDGMDNAGNPAPAGKYTWKLLRTPGFKSEYLFTIGSNYPYGDHYWEIAPGTHESVHGVARDDSGLYVGAAITENIENFLVKLSPDGTQRLWSAKNPDAFKGAIALGVGSTELFVLTNNAKVLVYDKNTGDDLREFSVPAGATDLAANGTEMAVAFPNVGAVRVYNPDGDVIREMNLAGARSVAMDQKGVVWAATETKVVRYSGANGAAVDVATGLTKVTRIGVERSGNTLFVAEGEPSHRVKRYGADGSLQATFGTEGGRKQGVYGDAERHDFRDIRAIMADEQGGFWVSEPEAAPRRLARFDAKGDPQKELHGGQAWASWVAPEPGDPKHVWLGSDSTDLMRLELDFEAKTYKVVATYKQSGLGNGFVGTWGNAALVDARIHDGQTYLIHLQSGSVLRVDEPNRRLVAAAVARRYQHWDKAKEPSFVNDWAPAGTESYTWADADGDGIPQQGEMQFFKFSEWLGLRTLDDGFDMLQAGLGGIYTTQVTGWTAAKAPIYEHVQGPIAEKHPRITKIPEDRWGSYIYRDPVTKEIFGAFNDAMPTFGQSLDSFFTKWSAGGEVEWSVGRTLGETTAYAPPGEIGAFRRFAGRVGDAMVMTDFHEGPRPATTYVWNPEGLWAGGIIDNPDVSQVPPWRYGLGAEGLSSRIVPGPTPDEAIFFGTGLNETRVFRVTGFDQWERYDGAIDVAAALPAAQGSGPRVDIFEDEKLEVEIGTRQTASLSAASLASSAGLAARWSTEIVAPAAGEYTLHFATSGRVRAVLDGTTIVDAWDKPGSAQALDVPVTLDPTKRALLVVETAGEGGVSDLEIEWTPPGKAREPIPTAVLYPHLPKTLLAYAHGPGLKVEYFKGAKFDAAQKVHEEVRPNIDEDYGSDNDGLDPPQGLSAPYSVRVSGVIIPQYTGLYSFWNSLAGTSVYINEQKVGMGAFSDRWESETIQLEAGEAYPIRLDFSSEYIHPSQHRGFSLRMATPPGTWPRKPGTPPGAQFFPAPTK